MISVKIKGLSLLQFKILEGYPNLIHFSSIRNGGLSSDNYSSLNLGLHSGDRRENVVKNRELLCNALEIASDRFVFPKQTHTATVKIISESFLVASQEEKRTYLQDTDALITDLSGVCIAVKTADCVPVLLFDPKQKVIAAIHAGWRGTAQKIVVETINQMGQVFGSLPEDLIAAIGPSISPEVYEVGAEVYSQFEAPFCHPTIPYQSDKRLLDLWNANQDQLLKAGIPLNHIEVAQICTLSDPERFFSARRDGAKTGRMGSGIMLR
jgi:polyphenol oxidase